MDADVVGELVLDGAPAAPVARWSPMMATRHFRGVSAATALYAGFSVDGVHRVQPAREIVEELLTLVSSR